MPPYRPDLVGCLQERLFGSGRRPNLKQMLLDWVLGTTVLFTPHLAPMTRGILATCYARPTGAMSTADALALLHDFYADEPFVVVTETNVLPAGIGHQCLWASPDLMVIGTYPKTGKYDLCRGSKGEHARAMKTIPHVPLPDSDPVFGKQGPLLRLWHT